MRWYLLIGFLLWIGTAEAQRGSYFGVGASYYTTFAESYLYPSFQIGGPISIGELRGTLESIVIDGRLGLDFLYPLLATPNIRLYTGGGVVTRLYLFFPDSLDVRAVFGGEYFFASQGGSAPLGGVRRSSHLPHRTSHRIFHRGGPRRR